MESQKSGWQEALFRDTYHGRPIEIRIGWGRALQRHYLKVQYTDGKREFLYRSDDDPNVTRYTDLIYYLRYLLSLGVRIPREAVRAVSAAPLWSFSKPVRGARSAGTAVRFPQG